MNEVKNLIFRWRVLRRNLEKVHFGEWNHPQLHVASNWLTERGNRNCLEAASVFFFFSLLLGMNAAIVAVLPCALVLFMKSQVGFDCHGKPDLDYVLTSLL